MARRSEESGSGHSATATWSLLSATVPIHSISANGSVAFSPESSKSSFILIRWYPATQIDAPENRGKNRGFIELLLPLLLSHDTGEEAPDPATLSFELNDLLVQFLLLAADGFGGDNFHPDKEIAGLSAPFDALAGNF